MEIVELFEDNSEIQSYRNNDFLFAFLDESGGYGFDFDKDGVTSHFIITAIICEQDKVDAVREKVQEVKKKHFQTGEMKSQSVARNDIRRIKVLQDLKEIDFKIFAFIVDKKKIFEDSGIHQSKEVFLKYLYSQVHHELFISFPNLQMVNDEHGRKEFMDGFKKYVANKHPPNLFGQYSFGFMNSKAEVLVQLADFIGGTFLTGYNVKKISTKYKDFYGLIKDKIIGLREWPENFKNYILRAEIEDRSSFDRIIAELSIKSALDFVRKNDKSDDYEIQNQVLCLRYLLFKLKYDSLDRYVPTHELLNNLHSLGRKVENHHQLRTRIIAKLRDEGAIIASCNRGYKLPVSEKELYDFANQNSLIIMPMLNRLKKCREKIILATQGQLDILDKPEYEDLKKFFDE